VAKVAKAMIVDDAGLPTNNTPVGVGVTGWDSNKADLYYEVPTTNAWHDIDFTFTTGTTLKSSQKVYFNSGTGYIDNWEMYEIGVTALKDQTLADARISVNNKHIVAELELRNASEVEMQIYNLNGGLIQKMICSANSGNNTFVSKMLAGNGIYMVKLISADSIKVFKVIL
jgi:hypothetical protein